MMPELTFRPGVPAILDQLEAASIPFGIASNSTVEWVDEHLKIIGLRDRFEVIWTRDRVIQAKPAPYSYLAACSELNVDPEEAIAFEDSNSGTVAAVTAGLYCVAVPSRITESMDFSEADEVIDSFDEITVEDLAGRFRKARQPA